MSDSSKLFKKKQVILQNEAFVVSIPKLPKEVISALSEEEASDPVELALSEKHHLLSEADLEAQEIIAGAKRTAEEIILDSYDKAEEIRRTAREEGYRSGEEAAHAEYDEKISEAMGELDGIKRELLEARKTLFQDAEKEIIDLVLRTLDRMVSLRIEQDEELVTALVQKSVAGLTHVNNILVRISEADHDCAQSIRNRLMLGAERIDTVEIKIDETLQPGSCVVETDRGTINSGLDLQLERVRRAFRSLIEE